MLGAERPETSQRSCEHLRGPQIDQPEHLTAERPKKRGSGRQSCCRGMARALPPLTQACAGDGERRRDGQPCKPILRQSQHQPRKKILSQTEVRPIILILSMLLVRFRHFFDREHCQRNRSMFLQARQLHVYKQDIYVYCIAGAFSLFQLNEICSTSLSLCSLVLWDRES